MRRLSTNKGPDSRLQDLSYNILDQMLNKQSGVSPPLYTTGPPPRVSIFKFIIYPAWYEEREGLEDNGLRSNKTRGAVLIKILAN